MTDTVVVALIAGAPGIITAVMAAINSAKISTLGKSVNGRMTQLIATTKTAAHAEGVKQGIESKQG